MTFLFIADIINNNMKISSTITLILLICVISSISVWLISLSYTLDSDIISPTEIFLDISGSQIESYDLIRDKTPPKSSSVKCQPHSFGVSAPDDEIFFPKKIAYFECNKKNSGELKVVDNEIFFDCDPQQESFIFGGDLSEEIFGNYDMNFVSKPKEHYKSSNNIEWFFAKCKGKKALAYLENKFNSTAAQRAKAIQEKLFHESNNVDSPRPLTVLMLMLDSVSRQSFFRNLPKTVKFLNKNLVDRRSYFGKKFVIYDFLINNVQGRKTVFNMVPILYGKTSSAVEDHLTQASIKDVDDWPYYEEFQKKSILSYFKDKGFVTLFSFDTYSDSLSAYTGRKISTDHVIANFWRAANKISDYSEYSVREQCIGNKYAHTYTLNYLKQYIKNYSGYNRFAYAHSLLAHEPVGSRLQLIDDDLVEFIKEILEFYSKHNEEDIVLMIGADHGRMIKKTSKEAMGEVILPFQFIISNKSFIQRIDAHQNLMHNTQRLVTRFDWFVTLKHLANMPYNKLSIQELEEISKKTSEHKGISLFAQQVKDSRDCNDINIDSLYCSCNYLSEKIKDPLKSDHIKDIIKMAKTSINEFIKDSYLKGFCNQFIPGDILSADIVYVDKKGENESKNYFIVIQDKYNKDFAIKVVANFFEHKTKNIIRNKDKLHPKKFYSTLNQRGKKIKHVVQIFSLTNINDNYKCANTPKFVRNYEKFCNCYS